MPALHLPNVSVKVEITSLLGVRLDFKSSGVGTVNFDVKAKLEEKERKSQMVVVAFSLYLTTKPNIVKFEVEGIATLNGKEAEISKMLETDPETKVPYIFQKIYQHAFTAMYLMSTFLNTPPPPQDLLFSQREIPIEEVSAKMEPEEVEKPETAEPEETVTMQVGAVEEVSEEKVSTPTS